MIVSLENNQEKIEIPGELEELLTNSYVSLGKKYGVSDNTIRKWIKAKNPS